MIIKTIELMGERMDLHDTGEITRPAIGMFIPSGKWKVIGAVELNNFGKVVKRYSLRQITSNPHRIPWKWNNGKQRVFVMDLDHGTKRMWTNDHCIY